VRVTIQQLTGEGVIFKIEGKIAGPSVSALDQAWRDSEASLEQRKLLVDLRGVTYVDGAGRKLLAEISEATGAVFVGDTPLTKYFAEEAQKAFERDLNTELGRQS
jgi:anti-anti-sigma regulatory factor